MRLRPRAEAILTICHLRATKLASLSTMACSTATSFHPLRWPQQARCSATLPPSPTSRTKTGHLSCQLKKTTTTTTLWGSLCDLWVDCHRHRTAQTQSMMKQGMCDSGQRALHLPTLCRGSLCRTLTLRPTSLPALSQAVGAVKGTCWRECQTRTYLCQKRANWPHSEPSNSTTNSLRKPQRRGSQTTLRIRSNVALIKMLASISLSERPNNNWTVVLWASTWSRKRTQSLISIMARIVLVIISILGQISKLSQARQVADSLTSCTLSSIKIWWTSLCCRRSSAKSSHIWGW